MNLIIAARKRATKIQRIPFRQRPFQTNLADHFVTIPKELASTPPM